MPHIADEELILAALNTRRADDHPAHCPACAADVDIYRRIAEHAAEELRRQNTTGVLRRLWPSISELAAGREADPPRPGPGGIAA